MTGLALGLLLVVVLGWACLGAEGPSLDVGSATRVSLLPLSAEQDLRVEWNSRGLDVSTGITWDFVTMSLSDVSMAGELTVAEAWQPGPSSNWAIDATLSAEASVLPAPRLDATLVAEAGVADLTVSTATKLRADISAGVAGFEQLDVAYETELVSLDLDVDAQLPPFKLALLNASGEGVFLQRSLDLGSEVVRVEGRAGFDAAAFPSQDLRTWLELEAQWRAWSVSSYTRLEDSGAGIGTQRFAIEAQFLDAILPGGQGTLTGAAGLRVPLVPAGAADVWSRLAVESAEATGEILASLRLDSTGPESAQISGQLEGEWTTTKGLVEARAQLDATTWSRDGASSFGLDLGIKAVRERRLSADMTLSLEVTASLQMGQDGIALRIGAAASPTLRLAGPAL